MLIGAGVVAVLLGVLAFEVLWTRPVRRSVRTYNRLIDAANRQDLAEARRLCSARYLRTHDLEPAAEGGLVGLPRNIHKNFQAWRQGPNVWLCPTNRVGPVFQFVREGDDWKFDGPVGLLLPRGEMILSSAGETGP
jgi:hypothetical protein